MWDFICTATPYALFGFGLYHTHRVITGFFLGDFLD